MLCLSRFEPVKVGRGVKRTVILFVVAVLTYAVCWGVILKGLDFKVQGANQYDNKLQLSFLVSNKSFGDIHLKDLNFYNDRSEVVPKSSENLPLMIRRYSSETLDITFDLDAYDTVGLRVKILGLEKSIKAKMNKGSN